MFSLCFSFPVCSRHLNASFSLRCLLVSLGFSLPAYSHFIFIPIVCSRVFKFSSGYLCSFSKCMSATQMFLLSLSLCVLASLCFSPPAYSHFIFIPSVCSRVFSFLVVVYPRSLNVYSNVSSFSPSLSLCPRLLRFLFSYVFSLPVSLCLCFTCPRFFKRSFCLSLLASVFLFACVLVCPRFMCLCVYVSFILLS